MQDVTPTPDEGAVPAAPEAEAEKVAVEGETPEQPAKPDGDDPAERKPKGVQKRIDELTQLRRSAERERDHWREMAMRGNAPKPEPQRAALPQGKPTREQFQTEDEFLDAFVDWKAEQKLKAVQEKAERENAQKAEQERQKAFNQRIEKARSKYEDFEEVAFNPDLPITPQMADVIRLSDVGDELAYYLGKNPDRAQQIAQMQPMAAALALGRIEASLSQPAQPRAAPPPAEPVKPKLTKAPPPPSTISTNAPVEKDPEKMTADEWLHEWRLPQLRKARK